MWRHDSILYQSQFLDADEEILPLLILNADLLGTQVSSQRIKS